MRKGCVQNSSTATSTPHPMASHLSWMFPPLLKLLRAIHALWSPSVFQVLPGEIKAAMSMSDVDRSSLLGIGNPKLSKGALTFNDGSRFVVNKEGYTEPNETDIRNWLKGIRDSGYNVMGLSTTIGDPFFKYMDIDSVALALVENIQSMEFRHTRQLVHSVLIPLVKSCPTDMWEVWLEKLLHTLFVHCQQALSCSWFGLLCEGRAKVPDHHDILTGSDLKVEPSLEHSGHVSRVDMSSLKDLDAFASSSMVGFLLKHKSLAIPVLQISLEAFTWTDSEAVTKVCSFSAVVVILSILTNNVDLQGYVSRDLFSAVIQEIRLPDRFYSLPCITPNDLHAFEEALTKTASPKEQKQHMKSLLLLATGNNLKSLTAQKNVNVITNVTARPRGSVNTPGNRNEEGDSVGLAAIL
ncbi:Protein HASTY 1 [Hibiscus syriacus]|uniref:Protein HASTY 1 n=1 Tax=Hibiscus syriacus TaxID=106335 RepID=A0A6A3B2V3_HIBSY|nr:Protein HASTY 1 [Hibiscus syriacus]